MSYLYNGPCDVQIIELPEKHVHLEQNGDKCSFVTDGYMPFSEVYTDADSRKYVERGVYSGPHQCDAMTGVRKEYLLSASELYG